MNNGKSIIDSMLESGMSKEEINNFFLETFDIDLRYNLTECLECKFYKNINGIRTCGKQHKFLKSNVSGCYSGERW